MVTAPGWRHAARGVITGLLTTNAGIPDDWFTMVALVSGGQSGKEDRS